MMFKKWKDFYKRRIKRPHDSAAEKCTSQMTSLLRVWTLRRQVDTTVCRQIQILKEKQSTEITNVDMFPHGRRRYESADQSAGLICLLSFSWKKPIWSEDHKKCVQEQKSHIEETCVYKTDWISAANSEHLTVFLFHDVHHKNIFREKSFIQTTTSISDLLSAVRTQTFLIPIFVLAN